MVTTILELMAGGMTMAELLEDYPALEMDDIFACLDYAALSAHVSAILQPTGRVWEDGPIYRHSPALSFIFTEHANAFWLWALTKVQLGAANISAQA